MAIRSGEWQYDSKGVGYKKTSTGWKKEGDSSGARYNSPAETAAYQQALKEAKAEAKRVQAAQKLANKNLQSTTFTANYNVNDVIRHEEKGMTVLYKKDGTILGAFEPGAVVYRRGKLLVDQRRTAAKGNYSFKTYTGDKVEMNIGSSSIQYKVTPKEQIISDRLKSYVNPSTYQYNTLSGSNPTDPLENWINNRKEVIAKNSRYWRTTGENIAGKPGRMLGGLVAFGVNFVNGSPVVMAYDMVDSTGKQAEIALASQKIYSQGRTASPEEVQMLEDLGVDWKNTDFVLNTASGIKQDFQNDPYGAFGETVLPLFVAGAAGRTRVSVKGGKATVRYGNRGVSVRAGKNKGSSSFIDDGFVDLETFNAGSEGFESFTRHFDLYKLEKSGKNAIEYSGRTDKFKKGNIELTRSARRQKNGKMRIEQSATQKGKNGRYGERYLVDENGSKFESFEYEMDQVGKVMSKSMSSEEIMSAGAMRRTSRLRPKSKVNAATREHLRKGDIGDVYAEMDIADKLISFDINEMTMGREGGIKRAKRTNVQRLNEKGSSKSLKTANRMSELTERSFLDIELDGITKDIYDLEPSTLPKSAKVFKGKGMQTPLSKTFAKELGVEEVMGQVMDDIFDMGTKSTKSKGKVTTADSLDSVLYPELSMALDEISTKHKSGSRKKSKQKQDNISDLIYGEIFGDLGIDLGDPLQLETTSKGKSKSKNKSRSNSILNGLGFGLDDILGVDFDNIFDQDESNKEKRKRKSGIKSTPKLKQGIAQSYAEFQIQDVAEIEKTKEKTADIFDMFDTPEIPELPEFPEFTGFPTPGSSSSDTGKKKRKKSKRSGKGKTKSKEIDWFSPF